MPVYNMRKFFFVLASVLFVSSVRADMIITVTDGSSGTFVDGSINQVDVSTGPGTVKLSVWAHDTAAAGRQFNGFNLAFDLSPLADISIASSFTLTSGSVSNPAIATGFNIDLNRTNRTNYDFMVNAGAGNSVILTGLTSPVKLFDLMFTAAQNTAPGLYDLRFVPGASDSTIFGVRPVNAVSFTNGDTDLAASGGQFRITAVPEPSSVLLVACFGLAGGYYWRRRRAVV